MGIKPSLKFLICFICFLFPLLAKAQLNITAMEYFFDTDPGVGNGIAIPVVAGQQVTLEQEIDVSGLSRGLHFLYVRVKNENDEWGIPDIRPFTVRSANPVAAITDIETVEYFIDEDLGPGNGTLINFTTSSAMSLVENIDVSGLSSGLHFLYFRVRNENGEWGVPNFRPFTIRQADPAPVITELEAMEYFVDEDPGVGNGTPLSFTVAASASLVENIDISAYSNGLHYLYVRTKNVAGDWGVAEVSPFVIKEAAEAPQSFNIARLAYFFNDDPGVGLEEQVVFDPSVANLDSAISFNTGGLPVGDHVIGIRIQDDEGKWSTLQTRDFSICDGPDALFTVPDELVTGFPVTFTDGSADVGATDTYRWDFDGDGTFDDFTSGDVTHTYAIAEEYEVNLQIEPVDGCTANFSLLVSVEEPEPEISVFQGTVESGVAIADDPTLEVNMGTVDWLQVPSQLLTISNAGTDVLTISSLTFSGDDFDSDLSLPVNIAGGNSRSFTISLVSGSTAGVFMENIAITSNDADEGIYNFQIRAEVLANTPPSISALSDIAFAEDGNAELMFTIGDNETAVDDLQVTVSSGNDDLIMADGLVLSGSGSNRTLTLTALADSSGTSEITVAVMDDQVEITETFTLTVNPVNDLPVINSQNSLSMAMNTSLELTLSDFEFEDIDNDQPEDFNLTIIEHTDFMVSGQVITPVTGFTGELIVPVQISDGSDVSMVFNANITVEKGLLTVSNESVVINSGDGILSFPELLVGEQAMEEVVITNVGNHPIELTEIIVSDDDFILSGSFPTRLEVGGSTTVTITANPVGAGITTATLSIVSNSADLYEITLSANAFTAPAIEVSLTSTGTALSNGSTLTFANTQVGETFSQSLTITNAGGSPLELTAINIDNADFTLVDELPDPILAGESAEVTVSFNPATIGSKTASLSITHNAGAAHEITLSANAFAAPAIEVSLTSTGAALPSGGTLTFADTQVGETFSQSLTITNVGGSPLELTAINIDNADFTLVDELPDPILADASAEVVISFNPATAGDKTANLSITHNAGAAHEITLSANAFAAPAIEVSLTSTGAALPNGNILTFADTQVGETFSQSLTITNVGGSPLELTAINIDNADFTLVDELPDPILADESAEVTVSFNPATIGSKTASLSITHNAGAAHEITLSANAFAAPAIEVSLTSTGAALPNGSTLTFADTQVGETFSQSLTITNSGGSPLELTAINIDNADFTLVDALPDPILAGESAEVTVSFNPATAGDKTASLSITHNAGAAHEITLSANAFAAPAIEVSQNSSGQAIPNGGTVSYDDLPIGASSEQQLEILNVGNSELVITEWMIAGEGFEILSDLPDPIAPGEAIAITIAFSPVTEGVNSAQLILISNAGSEFSINLSASGIAEKPPIEVINVVTTQLNGKHDFLEIRNIEFYDSSELRIYTRWGKEVFRSANYSNDMTNGFIGKSTEGDSLPEGTYYYTISLEDDNQLKTGFILLR